MTTPARSLDCACDGRSYTTHKSRPATPFDPAMRVCARAPLTRPVQPCPNSVALRVAARGCYVESRSQRPARARHRIVTSKSSASASRLTARNPSPLSSPCPTLRDCFHQPAASYRAIASATNESRGACRGRRPSVRRSSNAVRRPVTSQNCGALSVAGVVSSGHAAWTAAWANMLIDIVCDAARVTMGTGGTGRHNTQSLAPVLILGAGGLGCGVQPAATDGEGR